MPELKDFLAADTGRLVEEELDTFCRPGIKDRHKASTEDLVKDLHYVIAGNGSESRGLLRKTAETRVDVARLHSEILNVGQRLRVQEEFCQSVQQDTKVDRAIREATRAGQHRVLSVIWRNKAAVILVSYILFSLVFTRDVNTTVDGLRDDLQKINTAVKQLSSLDRK
jgi:hypothetical protein